MKIEKVEKVKTPKISEELATEEIERWLDYKKIDETQRDESSVKALISYVQSGYLILNDDHSFTHKLKFELEKAGISELVYKPRITEREIASKLVGIKSDDVDGRIAATIAALTGQVIGIIKAMDKEDFKIARAIALFFL